MKIKDVSELDVWKKAHEMVMFIYKITSKYPKEELYGLISQIRRAAVSVPANISEGFSRFGKKDKIRFYNIAQGSLGELDYYVMLSKDLKYLSDDYEIKILLLDIKKLLAGLIRSLNNNPSS